MKHSIYLSLLTASTLFLVGCNATDDASTTTISGSTTLSNALVCVDSNKNLTCDSSEDSVQTSDNGEYTLETSNAKEGARIIATDGYNLVLAQSNLRRFTYVSTYHSDEETHNINTLSTLVSQNDEDRDTARANIASKYNLDATMLSEDPLDLLEDEEGKKLFLTIRAIEDGVSQKLEASSKRRALRATDSTTVITEDDADSALLNTDIFDFDLDEYIYKLGQYFDDVSYYVSNLFSNYVLDTCFLDDTCGENDNVPRDVLNGVWYLQGDNNTSACVEITPQSTYTQHNFDTINEYSIYYREYANEFSILSGWNEVGLMRININKLLPEADNTFNSLSLKYSIDTSENTQNMSMTRKESLSACRVSVEAYAESLAQ